MSKEKQIEEMARFVCSSFHGHHDCENCSLYEERCCLSFCAAKRLYNAGYRKHKEGENVSGTPSLFECSVCHWRDYDTCTADTSEYNYCPNCGAKMIIESKYTEDNQ